MTKNLLTGQVVCITLLSPAWGNDEFVCVSKGRGEGRGVPGNIIIPWLGFRLHMILQAVEQPNTRYPYITISDTLKGPMLA